MTIGLSAVCPRLGAPSQTAASCWCRPRRWPPPSRSTAPSKRAACSIRPAFPASAQLVGRVLDRGSLRRSASVIAEELDERGVALRVTTTRHRLGRLVHMPGRRLPRGPGDSAGRRPSSRFSGQRDRAAAGGDDHRAEAGRRQSGGPRGRCRCRADLRRRASLRAGRPKGTRGRSSASAAPIFVAFHDRVGPAFDACPGHRRGRGLRGGH